MLARAAVPLIKTLLPLRCLPCTPTESPPCPRKTCLFLTGSLKKNIRTTPLHGEGKRYSSEILRSLRPLMRRLLLLQKTTKKNKEPCKIICPPMIRQEDLPQAGNKKLVYLSADIRVFYCYKENRLICSSSGSPLRTPMSSSVSTMA